jgi:hypothetical protein
MSQAQVQFTITGTLDVDAQKLLEAILAATAPKGTVTLKFGPVSDQQKEMRG